MSSYTPKDGDYRLQQDPSRHGREPGRIRSLAEDLSQRLGAPVGIEKLEHGEWEIVEVVQQQTWTFLGHWTDADTLVIDEVLDGQHDDTRLDDGTHAGGLWAASGSGFERERVMADVIAEYEMAHRA